MKNDIDKHIKNHKDDLNLDIPPMDAWDNIEARLDKKKKRKFFYLPYAASIGLVLTAGVGFLIFNHQGDRLQEVAMVSKEPVIGFRCDMIRAGTDYGDGTSNSENITPPPTPSEPLVSENKNTSTITSSGGTDIDFVHQWASGDGESQVFSNIAVDKPQFAPVQAAPFPLKGGNVINPKTLNRNPSGEVPVIWDLNPTYFDDQEKPIQNTESYAHVHENDFVSTLKEQTSTFSIDVDAASYSNVRRMIMDGQIPPADAVRIEEMINYFDYNYANPTGQHPFSISNQITDCPWTKGHQLVKIGIQGKKIASENLPTNNLVFLLDVSGSMMSANKLQLLKKSFKLLTDELRSKDKVSIVVYAGASGLVLPPTSGNDKTTILDAIDKLEAGGSTAGGQGIELAYKTAEENFDPKGNNRILLATDGDFNVGISGEDELVKLIEEKRKSGIFLTCLGFGTGNYQDSKMEVLADNGNGNYSYIDNIVEAKKVLVTEMGATLNTIAKDVKIQIEFNPNKIQAYRLIGYENRVMENKDFANDRKDAGELGSGHNVTALYEVIPVGVKSNANFENYKYTKPVPQPAKEPIFSDELCTVRFRYKTPQGTKSKLIETVLKTNPTLTKRNIDFGFVQAVAGFGMILKNSQHKGSLTIEQVLQLAKANKGNDLGGYRAEFIRLVEVYQLMNK